MLSRKHSVQPVARRGHFGVTAIDVRRGLHRVGDKKGAREALQTAEGKLMTTVGVKVTVEGVQVR
jgi:hypothetical protein